MSQPFLGFGGLPDDALLRSGEEALAIGFPLDGPVRDAALMCLIVCRNATKVQQRPDYLAYLERVQARYPEAYEAMNSWLVEQLQRYRIEATQAPLHLCTCMTV